MDLTDVIARIRDQAAGTFGTRVAGAGNLERVLEDVEGGRFKANAACWVLWRDEPLDSQTADRVTQRIDDIYDIVVALSNTADERGQAAADNAKAVRDTLIATLNNWQPTGSTYAPLQYVGSEEQASTRAHLWWLFSFRTFTVV